MSYIVVGYRGSLYVQELYSDNKPMGEILNVYETEEEANQYINEIEMLYQEDYLIESETLII